MGAVIPPEYGVPLTADELKSTIPTSILYGVTPSNEFIPVKITSDGTVVTNATFTGTITVGEVGIQDESTFVYGTSLEQPVGGVYQDTNPTLSAGETGAVRLTQYRAFHVNLRDSSGVELTPATQATAASILADLNQFTFSSTRLLVDGSQVTQPVSGTVVSTIPFYTRSDTYTTTGNGIIINATTSPTKSYSIVVTGTGSSASSWDVRLEGSLDNIKFTPILQHTNTTGDGVVLYGGATLSPSLYIRTRCNSLVLGSATDIVVTLLGI